MLYIPTDMDDTDLATTFRKQIHQFLKSFAYTSPVPQGIVSRRREWAVGTLEGGGRKKEMTVHVFDHQWRSKSDEQGYKEGERYEKRLRSLLRKAERLGMEWELMQLFADTTYPPIRKRKDMKGKGCSCDLM